MKFKKIIIYVLTFVVIFSTFAICCFADFTYTFNKDQSYVFSEDVTLDDLKNFVGSNVFVDFYCIVDGVRHDYLGFGYSYGLLPSGDTGFSFGYIVSVSDTGAVNRDIVFSDSWVNNDYRYITFTEDFVFTDDDQFSFISEYYDSPVSVWSVITKWLVSCFNNVQGFFFVNGELTFLGTLCIFIVAFGLGFLLLGFIVNFLRFRS